MIKKIIKTLIGNASSILDEVITTDEARDAAKQKLEALLKTHEKENNRNNKKYGINTF